MQIIKHMLLATSMLMVSVSSFAFQSYLENKTVHTPEVSTKAAAYDAALTKLSVLQSGSMREMAKGIGGLPVSLKSVMIKDGAYVTVTEKKKASGQVFYSGVIHVSVVYQQAHEGSKSRR